MVKNPPANAGDARDMGSIFMLERFPGKGNGKQLQYSCLENPMDRGAWQAILHEVSKKLDDLVTKQQQHFKLHICPPFQNKISVSAIQIGHSLIFVFLFLFKLKYYPGPSTRKEVKDLPSPLSGIIH